MFEQENTIEKETGIVTITDSPLEVMSEFLTFIYTGDFKQERIHDGELAWIGMIPELVYVADKVGLNSLSVSAFSI